MESRGRAPLEQRSVFLRSIKKGAETRRSRHMIRESSPIVLMLKPDVKAVKISCHNIQYHIDTFRMQQESILSGRFSGMAILFIQMDGQKMDWIRKQLGMTKVQFHHELGISRMHLFRCLRDGPPKLGENGCPWPMVLTKDGRYPRSARTNGTSGNTGLNGAKRRAKENASAKETNSFFRLQYVSVWYLLYRMKGLLIELYDVLF